MRSLLNCKGQSIIEITLMTPLILAALYVTFDFGMAIFTGQYAQIAVRDGARIAANIDEIDDTKAENLVAQPVYANLPLYLLSGKSVTVKYYADTGPGAGCAQLVEVTAQGNYGFSLYRFMRLLGFSTPDGITITRTTRMRYEFQPDRYGGTGAVTAFCTTASASGTYPSP